MIGMPDVKDFRKINKNSYGGLEAHVPHEIAHQWFYAAIGNDSYKEPWLDEGFVSSVKTCYSLIMQIKITEKTVERQVFHPQRHGPMVPKNRHPPVLPHQSNQPKRKRLSGQAGRILKLCLRGRQTIPV